MQMAKAKLYRMPLSNRMTIAERFTKDSWSAFTEQEINAMTADELDELEEIRKMAKVCFGCSMRHIMSEEDELCELNEDGQPFRSYHFKCAPENAVATEFQFLQKGYGPEKAKELAERANSRKFKRLTDLENETLVVVDNGDVVTLEVTE